MRERVESYLAVGWNGRFDVQEYIDAGDEVVVIWHMTGQSPLGRAPVDVPAFGHLYAFEDGKLCRVRQYFTRAEALEAAGLRE